MSQRKEKVVVAMSGGVDSSVAACLLVEQGFDVMGFFMRVGAHEPQSSDVPPLSDVPSVPGVPLLTSRGPAVPLLASSAPQPGSTSLPLLESSGTKPGPTNPSPVSGNGTRSHQGCCSAIDAADARYVAGMLGIPFYALNFQKDFDSIIDYFADEYARGRTPNPCVVCNDKLKFGKLVDYADAVGAKYIATGHYARIVQRTGRPALARSRDTNKDQSYVLFGLKRDILDRVMFPIGDLTKPQVREIAARFNLPNQSKPDSVDICFVPDRNYARVVRERRPEAFIEGDVVDSGGRVVGRHDGVPNYTVGQRRGLGIAMGKPAYVTQLDSRTNTVTLGAVDCLLATGLIGERANFLVDVDESFRALVKIRYLHTAVPAMVTKLNNNHVRVIFDEPQRAVTPGQATVFYDGDVVIGGAWISGPINNSHDSGPLLERSELHS